MVPALAAFFRQREMCGFGNEWGIVGNGFVLLLVFLRFCQRERT